MSTVTAARPSTSLLRLACEVCERRLEPVHFPDGECWTVRQLAMWGRRKHLAVLCWACYQAAGVTQRTTGGPQL